MPTRYRNRFRHTAVMCLGLILALAVAFPVNAADDEGWAGTDTQRAQLKAEAWNSLKADYPAVKTYRQGSLITRLYGAPFGTGSSPAEVAEQFRNQRAGLYGLSPDELVSGRSSADKLTSMPLMYNPRTGQYKFTLLHYRQEREGVPVYGSELRLLIRNEPGNPLVMAVSSLRDLGAFQTDKNLLGSHSAIAEEAARADEPELTDFAEQEVVIWSGINDVVVNPRMAVTFIGSSDFPHKFRYVVDPYTGEILHKEDLIIFEDLSGTVSGNDTEGPKAMECAPEVPTGFPWAEVEVLGGPTVYTDRNGYFTILNAGSSPLTLVSYMRGTYFEVDNYAGLEDDDTVIVTPPGPATFMHNALNNSDLVRAQTNGYVDANQVRDWALTWNPSYPVISTQTGFPVNVNRTDGYCPGNAWYSSMTSINFCQAGDGYANTAFASVLQHEYGHHLIETGGSGQGQYGEGMSDCVAMLNADDPGLGYGFYINDCDNPLRNADNDMQYPCDGAIHYCGQLLSGCVWSTRNELTITEPDDYLDILSALTVNSILLHTGTEITPQITIDFLTLDDDDGNLDNGTPHYWEIAAGFGAHNMPAPELVPLLFDYPAGVPEILDPNQPTTFQVVVTGQAGNTPVQGTGRLYYRVDGGSVTDIPMTETSPNHYDATLPGFDCYSTVEFYVSADAEGMGTFYNPGVDNPFLAVVATDFSVVFADDFETNQGWTVTGDATDGQWTRGIPIGGGDRGDPPTDYDGSGQCYLTDNVDDNSDVDGGTTRLHSPTIDLSSYGNARIHYARWYSNNYGADPHNDIFEVYISDNNGATWTLVEQVGPVEQAAGGWYEHSFYVGDFVSLTDQIKMRFDASDLYDGSVVEAAVDDFQVTAYECESSPDPDGDGILTGDDNCPYTYNPGQEDGDGDTVGDVCDNCPTDANADQADGDGDTVGDVCDNCPADANPDQTDGDGDTYGNVCDNCPTIANPDQADGDSDDVGDLCDNCPTDANPNQADGDEDTYGDVCDNCPADVNPDQADGDSDGVGDLCDNCPTDANANQADGDQDGVGDVCDNCPAVANADQADGDNDGMGDACDNCPEIENPDQADADDDGIGDLCDVCPNDPDNDADSDGVCGDVDNCPALANPDQEDVDDDGIGDACDNCPQVANPDQMDGDDDNVGNACDNCMFVANPDQTDSDGDNAGDACDNCPQVANPDQMDGDDDNVGNACDNCMFVANPDQTDSDGDNAGDACDNCPDLPNPGQADGDSDDIGDLCDNCPETANPDQADTDDDGLGDVCDVCPNDPDNDADSDGVCGDVDNCPALANQDQNDADEDGLGDVCDDCTDTDGDGLGNPGYAANTCPDDNCPDGYNPDQADTDGDGIGDMCCCLDIRGNTDGDNEDKINIADVTYLADYLFGNPNGPQPGCPNEGDVDADGNTNITDLTYVVNYLFGTPNGPEPLPCP